MRSYLVAYSRLTLPLSLITSPQCAQTVLLPAYFPVLSCSKTLNVCHMLNSGGCLKDGDVTMLVLR